MAVCVAKEMRRWLPVPKGYTSNYHGGISAMLGRRGIVALPLLEITVPPRKCVFIQLEGIETLETFGIFHKACYFIIVFCAIE